MKKQPLKLLMKKKPPKPKHHRSSWKQHLEIIVFQLQMKADIALPDISSTISPCVATKGKMPLNVKSLQNIIAHFAQANGLTGGTNKGRMGLSQAICKPRVI
ncbi:hypothetical protein LXL04_016888 [Taraxacum kok-saghyz]